MREHADLPAMVGFVSEHVAEHLRADRPRLSPAVSVKFLDAATGTAECFGEHLGAASGALGQGCAGLLRRAVRAVELWWNLQVRGGKPDPLRADVVYVREDRGDGADAGGFCWQFAWQFCFPDGGVEMFDEELVHAVVGGKDLDCRRAELSANLGLTGGHGSLLLELKYFRDAGYSRVSFCNGQGRRNEGFEDLHVAAVDRERIGEDVPGDEVEGVGEGDS